MQEGNRVVSIIVGKTSQTGWHRTKKAPNRKRPDKHQRKIIFSMKMSKMLKANNWGKKKFLFRQLNRHCRPIDSIVPSVRCGMGLE